MDRALPRGFAIATCVWVVAFIARLPQTSVESRALLALLLGVLTLGAIVIGWRTRSMAVTVASLLVAGVVNCLLVSSVVHSGDAASAEEVSRVTLQDWAWIPGNLLAAGVIGVVGGALGCALSRSGAGRSGAGRGEESLAQSQALLAALSIITTLCLISVGSLVTSLEVGLAVPDWPTSYGYNIFLFPFTKMVGGIYYEHAHRLIGTLVGMQVMSLCIWLWLRSPMAAASVALSAGRCPSCGHSTAGLERRRCPECGVQWSAEDERGGTGAAWLRRLPRFVRSRPIAWLGAAALILVVVQGLLGGFRVTFVNHFGDRAADVLAVVHACTAQLFMLGAALLAFVLHRAAGAPQAPVIADESTRLLARRIGATLVALALCQTLLGAITRHFGFDWALLLHVLGALAVVAAALTLGSIMMMHARRRSARAGAVVLMGSVVVQVLLGGMAWWLTTRLDRLDQVLDFGVTLRVSSHVVVGAIVLLESWLLTLTLFAEAPGVAVASSAKTAGDAPMSAQLQRGLA